MTSTKTYYIRTHGILSRDKNTLLYETKGEKKHLPVERVEAIIAMGNLTLKGGVIPFLAQHHIPIQFHNKYGVYQNTLQNVDKNMNGLVLREQARHCLDKEKRVSIARKMVTGAIKNLTRNLQRKNIQVNKQKHLEKLNRSNTIGKLMSVEGNFRKRYYQKLDKILPKHFLIERRSYRPPLNRMNALISFGNSLLYSTIMNEIYHTQLHPAISFLHEPFRQRYSLALDISEVFKPVIVDRVILKLVNRKEIQKDDFQEPLENFYLKERARDLFIKSFEDKLSSTIHHKNLKRNVSYRRLIRIEAFSLQKHILKDEVYSPYIISR